MEVSPAGRPLSKPADDAAIHPQRDADGYLPIECYGVVGNLRSMALVGLDGAIDWCCLPTLNRPSVFGALLDARIGGRFSIRPVAAWRSRQEYRDRTCVLDTVFETERGRLRLTDFMPLLDSILGAGDPRTEPEIHRLLCCEEGEVDVDLEWSPRFDYARAVPGITAREGGWLADAGGETMSLEGLPTHCVEIRDRGRGPVLHSRFRLRAGQRIAVVTRYNARRPGRGRESHEALSLTLRAWREWSQLCERPGYCELGGRWHDMLVRSALTLKLLTHPNTGAIAAAATTSLPEHIGGERNWDYRFSWIRDAAFTSQALFAMGHRAEARDFLEWLQDIVAARKESTPMQIMYGLYGESDLPEFELNHLEGYKHSRPVRIGNGAAKQVQHDIHGELLSAAYELLRLGGEMDARMQTFLAHVADRACEIWQEPDYGIWEVRGGKRHFVYSKLMVWVALDRAVRLNEHHDLAGDVERWRKSREAVAAAILEQGWDEEVGAFTQSFGSKDLDAANLLIPVVEFLPFSDPRVQGTIDRTLERLCVNGLVYRYDSDDGLPGGEGAFGLTTFWMIDCLALSGRLAEARAMFEDMARRANHLGLYAEEFDVRTGAFLGNFPQAFTHVGFINSALYLARAAGEKVPGPAPLGSQPHAQETGHDPGTEIQGTQGTSE